MGGAKGDDNNGTDDTWTYDWEIVKAILIKRN